MWVNGECYFLCSFPIITIFNNEFPHFFFRISFLEKSHIGILKSHIKLERRVNWLSIYPI